MRPQNDFKTLVFDVLLILLGVFGTAGCLIRSFSIPISPTLVVYLLLGTIAYFFIINTWHTHLRLVSVVSFLIYIFLFLLNFDTCKSGFLYIMNCVLQTYEANSQYSFQTFIVNLPVSQLIRVNSFTIWILFVPICMVIVYSIRQRSVYFLSFMVSIPFLFAILLFTLVPPWNFFIMLVIFYVAMLGMHVASRFDAHSSPDSIRKLGMVFTLCCVLVIAGIRTMVPMSTYVRSAQVDAFRLQIQSTIRDMIYGAPVQQTGMVDLATAKNRFYIGNVELRVKSSEQGTIYLHGYSGTLYRNNTWFTPEPEFYKEKFNFQFPPHPFDIANEYYEQLPESEKEITTKQALEVVYEDAFKTYVYTPYYNLESILDNRAYEPTLDAYLAPADEKTTTYNFTSLVEESLPERREPAAYAQMYMDAVMFTNLTVPTQVENALREISIPGINKASPKEDKIKAIQDYMKSFGTYTLSPGETPPQTDFISNFIKNKQGYCVHYASTATMLLRLYGVPARYAEGYRIDSADFEGDAAIVKDYNAHAWVEVFDERFGWVPLEVTPASAYGSGTTSVTLQNQDPEVLSKNQATNPNEEITIQTIQTKDDVQSTRSSSIIMPLTLLCLIFLAGSSIPIRRKIILKKKEEKQHQENYKEAILEVSKDIAYFVEDKELPENVKGILEEARFSMHKMQEEQYILTMEYKKNIRNQKLATCTKKQKMIYIWWYCV